VSKRITWLAVSALLLAAPLANAQPSRGETPEPGDDLPLVPWAHPPLPPEVPPSPSDGGGFFGGGVLFLTLGTLTTAAVAACHEHGGDWRSDCLGGVLGAGAASLALGGSLLAVGIVKRIRYRAWRRKHPLPPRPPRRSFARWVEESRSSIALAPSLGGGLLLLGGNF